MADQSIFNNTTLPSMAPTNPHEIALQYLCKQLLKSRLFRGFYIERLYVDSVKSYRDIISLQKSEKDLARMLRDIRDKLQLLYNYQNPQMWIGITTGPLVGITVRPTALETYLWVEMNDLAFGQYWFTIKSVRFRPNEIIIKLKEVQSIEEEEILQWSRTINMSGSKKISDNANDSGTADDSITAVENSITLYDFLVIPQQWWCSAKRIIYDFMTEDVSKENIKGAVRFLGLLTVFLISTTLEAVKFLGIFTLHFMNHLSRLTHTLTPITIKLMDVFSKIIGGFYILLAMMWKDAVGNRNRPNNNAPNNHRPMQSIKYDVIQNRPQLRNF